MKKQNHTRHVRYSIGLKFGLFVAIILIIAMVLVGIFIVRQQRITMEKNLDRNMTPQLYAFRSIVERFLRKKEDIRSIQKYTLSLAKIPAIKTAMFINSRSHVISDATWSKNRIRYQQFGKKCAV